MPSLSDLNEQDYNCLDNQVPIVRNRADGTTNQLAKLTRKLYLISENPNYLMGR